MFKFGVEIGLNGVLGCAVGSSIERNDEFSTYDDVAMDDSAGTTVFNKLFLIM